MKQKLAAGLLIAFFFGFPLAGMLIVWNDAHSKIRWRAEEFVGGVADDTFGKWDGTAIKENWNREVDSKVPSTDDWAKWKATYGDATEPVTLETYNSYTSERQDSMWQVVKMRVHVTGAKKKAVVDVEVARMTVGPKWHFESVAVQDAKP